MTEEVCALPYRDVSTTLEVLSFSHPPAGRQFVKGTLEVDESAAIGASRELREESGGLCFSFFWHPLNRDLDAEWHPIFHQAYLTIRASLPLIARTR